MSVLDEIDLDFGAITIDNATLKGEGYRFFEGMLFQMRQFKKSPVKVIQTDVVHNEAIKHISEEITKARSSIEQALRSANKHLKIKPDQILQAAELLSVNGSDREVAEQRINKFYNYVGAEKICTAELVELNILMNMYFEEAAPFESGKDKKNEFPDAIALLSIEKWAELNRTNVIAVSSDKGWKNFSHNSNRITVLASLSEALERFQPHNKVSSIIDHIREDSLLSEENHVLAKLESSLIASIDGYDISIEADSQFYFEYDDVFATYCEHELDVDHNGLTAIRIVRIDDENIVLKTGATVTVEVEAKFDFSVRDSVDRDYVNMGSSISKTTETYHTDILITLSGDFARDFEGLNVTEIEILETIKYVHFGEVEPDWRSEYEHEEP
jgi:PIN domain